MPSLPQSTPPPIPPAIDLSEISEATRRALYDVVVQVHFNPNPGEITKARKADEWYSTYGPDECGLTVLYLFGRWFVYWRAWDSGDDVPEAQEWFVLTAHPSLSARYGVAFQEV
jgi:hypothetical protein